MSDLRAIYFAGATYLFGTTLKEVQRNLFAPHVTTPQYVLNWFLLGFSGQILIDSIQQLLREN